MAIPTRDTDAPLTVARAVSRNAAEAIARSLRVLADPTRVQLLGMVVDSPDSRALVGQLATALGLRQPTVSHHMRLLADEGFLEREQQGRVVWYSVAPHRQAEVAEFLRTHRGAEPAPLSPALLERITEDLAVRFRGVFSVETIDRYVKESYVLLAERARITRYLPSLTSRFEGAGSPWTHTGGRLQTGAAWAASYTVVRAAVS